MPLDVTHECKACGDTATFTLDGERVLWDYGFSPCYTCAGLHYVCPSCMKAFGFDGMSFSDHRLPCFKSDEFRVAAAVMGGGRRR